MGKAEKFIKDCTMSCSNELVLPDLEWNNTHKEYNPCWSLSALYGILHNNKKESTTLSRGGWNIESIEYIDKWWCEYEDESHTKDFTVSAGNPVDACVAMIEKLHELNLL